MAGPSIVTTSPASGATGVPTNIQITITFDREVDTYRIANGGVYLEGPDESKAFGPGFLDLNPPETNEDDYLSSPGLKGIVECDYTFKRVDGSGVELGGYYDYGDAPDSGAQYRTQVVITPKIPLKALTDFRVIIVGDEDTDDDYEFGLSNRTVYDPRNTITGNGQAVFYGGFTGSAREQFFIEITTSGVSGTAQYEWWTSRDTVHKTGRTSNSYRLLKDGVYVKFPPGLNLVDGDVFSVWADVPEFMDGSYQFSFTTSSHEPETLPTPSTLVTGIDGTTSTTSSSSSFGVSSSDPEDGAVLVPITTTSFSVTFSDTLGTVTSSMLSVTSYTVDESVDLGIEATGDLSFTHSTSGAVLTITLTADQLYVNNLIEIVLDSSIPNSDGDTMDSDETLLFTTTLDPYYTGIRHVRLHLGSYGDSFTNEAIALAIWDASMEAKALAGSSVVDTDMYLRAKQMFTACYAAKILISGGKIASGGVRKRLDNLDISRDLGGITDVSNDLDDCMKAYDLALRTGGDIAPGTSIKPMGVVKGDNCYDTMVHGRRWESPDVGVGNANVLYPNRRRWVRTHRRIYGK